MSGLHIYIYIINYIGEVEYLDSILTYPPVDKYYFAKEKGNNILIEKTIAFPVQLNLSQALGLSTPQWFYNGNPIATTSNSKYMATYTIHGDTVHISLQINNSVAEDAGLYIFALNMDIYSLEFLQSCSDSRYYYIDYFRYYLSIYGVALSKAVLRIEEYRKFTRLHTCSYCILPACMQCVY